MVQFGSDSVVRWLEQAGVEYVAMNPGASFRGLHDSVVRSESIGTITALHEETAVGIAHGYAKAAGKPMAVFLHNLVGLQHASMAIFNAYMDNVPMLLIGGSGPRDAQHRRPWLDWIHTGNSQADLVREFVKWHSEPASIGAIPPSLARGYRIATTVPMGPVYLSIDVDLQESEVDGVELSPWPAVEGQRVGAPSSVVELVAGAFAGASRPVIIVDRPAPGAGQALMELVERTGAAVIDLGARSTFPSNHWADQTFDKQEALEEADVILALEARDLAWATTSVNLKDRTTSSLLSREAEVFSVGMTETQHRGFVDREAMSSGVTQIVSDVSVFLSSLLEHVGGAPNPQRVERLAERHQRRRAASREHAVAAGHDKVISVPWLAECLRRAVSGGRWQLANGVLKDWPRRLWDFHGEGSYLGRSGGEGLGYGLPASIGAALAADQDMLVVDIQSDGDLMYTASGLWTLAHHRIPLLVVVYNNRTYGKDQLHQTEVATLRGRSLDTIAVGISLDDPPIDFAGLARSQGVDGIGPITDPAELPDVLANAAAEVRATRRPILVDVVCPNSP